MAITREHFTGFVIGVGAAALGFYYYKKNQGKIDDFLRQQGINIPGLSGEDVSSKSLEELVREKERIEDIIAEREFELKNQGDSGKK